MNIYILFSSRLCKYWGGEVQRSAVANWRRRGCAEFDGGKLEKGPDKLGMICSGKLEKGPDGGGKISGGKY